jgi:UTP:GlnB (protein PII) uridylyltransferase
MLVCDVSAIDKLIDLYFDNLSVIYNDTKFLLYDLRDHFVDNNIECSIYDHEITTSGIYSKDSLIVEIDKQQDFRKDDTINI